MTAPAQTLDTRLTLLQRVRALDHLGWKEFFDLYDPLLRSYIGDCNRRHYLNLSEDDRDNIKQNIYVKLLKTMQTFELDRSGRGRFRTWLWRVAHNAAIDWVRPNRRRARAADGAEAPRPGRPPDTQELDALADDIQPPDEQVIEEQRWHERRYILEKVKAEMQSAKKWECFE